MIYWADELVKADQERHHVCHSDTLNNHHAFLTILMSIGFVVTLIPQMHKIIKYKSSDGLSPVCLSLSVIGGIANISNIIIIQFPILVCCKEVWALKICVRNLLTIFQQIVHAACQVTVLSLYFKYERIDSTRDLYRGPLRRFIGTGSLDTFLRVLMATITLSALIVFSVIFSSHNPEKGLSKAENDAAYLFGIVSSAVVSAQMLPQILKTSREGDVKSLSMETLFLQSIGSFFVAFIIALQPRANPSSWLSYIIGGLAQIVLLHICIKLYRRDGLTIREIFWYQMMGTKAYHPFSSSEK